LLKAIPRIPPSATPIAIPKFRYFRFFIFFQLVYSKFTFFCCLKVTVSCMSSSGFNATAFRFTIYFNLHKNSSSWHSNRYCLYTMLCFRYF
jgi:hypothetical protein